MKYLIALATNPYVITAISSWLTAQVLKTLIHFIVNKSFDITRLFGDGGMPSGHSATVTSLAVIIGLTNGLDTAEFAISCILAIIVCHDAMGVRLETGKQAMVLNEIAKNFEKLTSEKVTEVRLKEFVGHTPTQVAAGVVLGLVNGILMYNIL